MALPAETRIEGTVERIVYRNEANGYTVCEVVRPEDGEEVSVTGILPHLKAGDAVVLEGKWTEHPDYGPQFSAVLATAKPPDNEAAVLRYLSSGVVKGIGPATAKRLVARFGMDTLKALADRPDEVAKLKGIGKEKARRISASVRETTAFQDLAVALAAYGFGPGTTTRVFRQYGAGALEIVKTQPYRLAEEVYGIGFQTADRIARGLGLPADAPERLRAGFRHALTQATASGHCFLPGPELLAQASSLLGAEIGPEHPAYAALLQDPMVRTEPGPRFFLPKLFGAEKEVAERLLRLRDARPNHRLAGMDPYTALREAGEICAALGVTLAEGQKRAVVQAMTGQVCIVTGGPGTGKTTLVRVLVGLCARQDARVLLAAPTGRAAKRLADASGLEARTIHRLLEAKFRPGEETESFFERNAHNPLDCDLLIVDETSMVDVLLFRSLLAAVRPGTRLVLVGDADQLPSVGPGDVLRDCIASGALPVARLTEIFRQSGDNRIVHNAHLIHEGSLPEFRQDADSDFLLVSKETPADVLDAVVGLCARVLPARYGLDPFDDVQVLAPMRRGEAGVPELNRRLQEALNPAAMGPADAQADEESVEAHGFSFRRGDKVMQMRNDYALSWILSRKPDTAGQGVFNGDMGRVVAVDAEEGRVDVLFDDDRLARYDRAVLDELDPAYAVTVHKSQGSEFPVVVLALVPGPPILMTRNLLYTAVTRARRKLLLVGTKATVARMVRNVHESQRHTTLAERLSGRPADAAQASLGGPPPGP